MVGFSASDTPTNLTVANSIRPSASEARRVGAKGEGLLVRCERARCPPKAVYWGTSDAAVSIAGLFVLGFGISLFFPLVSGQAIGATLVAQHDRASARTALAGGVAILTMPGLLGELAGRVGLHNAHLLVPTLIVAMLAAFLVGRELERRHPFAHLDQ
ncbi:hypothetical protein D3227_27565 [Mesorhizobium waimense]|uniref:MFS transporter n=1 Tax=Mesorhizobium waimense TaxID=1300307 RepID=A0A3A5KAM5_9HYPH|nr:hypothetical protein D3227_27565 [Mesorhizobium waimense]